MITLRPVAALVDNGYDLVVHVTDTNGDHAAIHYPGRPHDGALARALGALDDHRWITAVEIRPQDTRLPLDTLHPAQAA